MGQLLHHLKEVFMHEDNCAVYVHVNLINGKKYFGITVQEPEKRWKNGKGYSNNDHFTNAINKYGWNNFAHYVLYRNIPIKIAKNIEEMLIDEHMSYDPRFGYNRTYGGELEIPNNETRRKISEAKKGENHHMYGKHHSEEVRKKISKANIGREVSKETRKAISKALSKPVEALDTESGQRVLYFKSTQDAGRAGFNQGHVVNCCRGERKTHAGLMWRYVQEVSDDDINSGQ